jgi:hypothetical protein
MKILLQIKAWQLFLIWAILFILSVISYIAGFLLILTFLLWVYSIGAVMNSFIPENIRPVLAYFQFSCVFLLVIMVAFSANDTYNIIPMPPWLELPVILYYLWSAFYVVMFAARMLKSATEGELVNRSDAFGTFLYIIFTLWGMWSIQKRAQVILADKAINKP